MYKIRPFQPNDFAFVANSYVRSQFDKVKPGLGAYPPEVLLSRLNFIQSDGVTHMIVSPEDDNHILGYAITHPTGVHFMYIKFPYRRFGIARSVVTQLGLTAPTVITHKPRFFDKVKDKYGLVFENIFDM